MFSGFTNQISGWVATKTGGAAPGEEDPNAQQQYVENGAEMTGEECAAGDCQQAGGVSGFAKGLMQKGMSIKDSVKEKATVLNPQALTGIGSNLMGGITNLIPGRKEEEVPDPNQVDMGGEVPVEEQQWQQWTATTTTTTTSTWTTTTTTKWSLKGNFFQSRWIDKKSCKKKLF